MEFQDQLVLSGNGQIGDCFRASLASVLGLKTLSVPHFALLGDLHALETAQAWLASKGFELWCLKKWGSLGATLMPMCIARGFSPRGIAHAVVADSTTGQVLHDPHPSRLGLVAVLDYYYLFKLAERGSTR